MEELIATPKSEAFIKNHPKITTPLETKKRRPNNNWNKIKPPMKTVDAIEEYKDAHFCPSLKITLRAK
jgi:hypothetical protein